MCYLDAGLINFTYRHARICRRYFDNIILIYIVYAV